MMAYYQLRESVVCRRLSFWCDVMVILTADCGLTFDCCLPVVYQVSYPSREMLLRAPEVGIGLKIVSPGRKLCRPTGLWASTRRPCAGSAGTLCLFEKTLMDTKRRKFGNGRHRSGQSGKASNQKAPILAGYSGT